MGGTRLDGGEPRADLVQEWCEKEASEDGRTLLEATKGATEERAGSDSVVAMEMVEGGGHLNEGLEEAFFGLIEFEPGAFPVFVRLEELPIAVAGETLGEIWGRPVEGVHGFSS